MLPYIYIYVYVTIYKKFSVCYLITYCYSSLLDNEECCCAYKESLL